MKRRRGKRDTRFLMLNNKRALAYDKLQWIIQQKQGANWVGISFVASTKSALIQVLMDRKIKPTIKAMDYIDAMPEYFREFIKNPPSACSAAA